ncbi:hypothetical protein FA15DRAFT_711301 [Coprinopsis marcescibilis]|uniref:Uncharacterized protein n=1 Tax=Coprinopsis marcescibilis TaxID=230819 RepID=A0A5C3KA16_COPMA|nr:hypothetical protein FA15DRAFT_711301 [Coprinopsis marcescibilis]
MPINVRATWVEKKTWSGPWQRSPATLATGMQQVPQAFSTITAKNVVSFVAEAMLELRLTQWYQAGQLRIDKLPLDEYFAELQQLVLDKNWAHDLQEEILNNRQEHRNFYDWKIEQQNKNAILVIAKSSFKFTDAKLKSQLEASLHEDIKKDLAHSPAGTSELEAWSLEVKERDEQLKEEEQIMMKLINLNNVHRTANAAACRTTLASHLSSPPVNQYQTPTYPASQTARRNCSMSTKDVPAAAHSTWDTKRLLAP